MKLTRRGFLEALGIGTAVAATGTEIKAKAEAPEKDVPDETIHHCDIIPPLKETVMDEPARMWFVTCSTVASYSHSSRSGGSFVEFAADRNGYNWDDKKQRWISHS